MHINVSGRSVLLFNKLILILILDRGHTDRVTTPKRAGHRRFRWPRPHHAARLIALAHS